MLKASELLGITYVYFMQNYWELGKKKIWIQSDKQYAINFYSHEDRFNYVNLQQFEFPR